MHATVLKLMREPPQYPLPGRGRCIFVSDAETVHSRRPPGGRRSFAGTDGCRRNWRVAFDLLLPKDHQARVTFASKPFTRAYPPSAVVRNTAARGGPVWPCPSLEHSVKPGFQSQRVPAAGRSRPRPLGLDVTARQYRTIRGSCPSKPGIRPARVRGWRRVDPGRWVRYGQCPNLG